MLVTTLSVGVVVFVLCGRWGVSAGAVDGRMQYAPTNCNNVVRLLARLFALPTFNPVRVKRAD